MLKKQLLLFLLLTFWLIGETARDYLKLAINSSEKGFYELSNKYLEEYIARNEKEFLDLAFLIYGYNLLKLEKYKEAKEKFEIILLQFPLSPYIKDTYTFLIITCLKIDETQQSLKYYKDYKTKFGKTEELEKQIGNYFLQKGIFHFKNKNFLEAKYIFNFILEEFKEKNILSWTNYYLGLIEFEKNNFKEALSYFEKVIYFGEEEMFFDSKLKTGDCYFNLGEYEKAEKYYKELIVEKDNIFSEWAKFQTAMIEKRKGNFKKAEEILKNIKPLNEDLKFNKLNELAGIYILLENWDTAENTLNEILKEFPEKKEISEIYFKLGIVNFNKRNFENSIQFLQKTLLISNENPLIKEKSLFFLGYIYYLKKNFNESFKYWDTLKNLYPESEFLPQILFLKGKKLYQENQFKEAEEVFKELVEKENSIYFEDSCIYLLEILIKRKKFEEGEKYAKKLLEKKKNDKFDFYLGKIYYLKGEYEKAEKIFKDLKIDDSSLKVEITFYLGDIYKKKKDYEKAKEKFIEIISLYPQFKEWKELAENSLKELKN
ncbi:MAG: tetratricopeptide repeat protein [Candidatus Omnitrophica bacterium]|nr:tetratricopeptide repeat protein [Candidatus Omnitrophota bacterium]MCM8806580.1 tetratricopeptide repeat protein [Candidatus Omnitrophota bacterium]